MLIFILFSNCTVAEANAKWKRGISKERKCKMQILNDRSEAKGGINLEFLCLCGKGAQQSTTNGLDSPHRPTPARLFASKSRSPFLFLSLSIFVPQLPCMDSCAYCKARQDVWKLLGEAILSIILFILYKILFILYNSDIKIYQV